MGRLGIDAINSAALVLALALGACIGWGASRAVPGPDGVAVAIAAHPLVEAGERGPAVRGADGVLVPVRDYRRIVDLVPELDDAFADLGMVDRLAAVSAYAREHSSRARQLMAVPGTVPVGAGIEDLLALKPDLVVVAAFSDAGRSERLRSAGVPILDVGAENGARDAALAIRRVAAVCGEAERGDALAARFERRLARVADPRWPRLRACYVSCWGSKLFGGSVGTSYADILAAAGFADAAAEHGYAGQLDLRIEDLLVIAPEIIVTGRGMGAAIAALPGAGSIPAVASGRIIEIDPSLLMSPGLAILDAAEAIAAARERLP